MTPTLRRSHRFLWLALAIVLPVGFGLALRRTSQPLTQEPTGPVVPMALPIMVRSVSNPDLTVTVRKAAQAPEWQLEVLVKTALETPSAVVRSGSQPGSGRWGYSVRRAFIASPCPAPALPPTSTFGTTFTGESCTPFNAN